MPDAAITSVATGQVGAREFLGSDVQIHSDWPSLLDNGDLKGLFVAVPPDVQVEIASAAIERGIPVFLEKPLALSTSDANRLVGCAEKHGAVVLVDHVHLFSDSFRRLLSERKHLGAVTGIKAIAGNNGPFRTYMSPLWDWGSHDIAMAISVLDAMPTRIDARITRRRATPEGAGLCYGIDLGFDGGRVATLEFGNAMEGRTRRFSASFQDQTLCYVDDGGAVLEDQAGQEIVRDDGQPPLYNAISHFLSLVEVGRPTWSQSVQPPIRSTFWSG